jgi:hypothetical protein
VKSACPATAQAREHLTLGPEVRLVGGNQPSKRAQESAARAISRESRTGPSAEDDAPADFGVVIGRDDACDELSRCRRARFRHH